MDDSKWKETEETKEKTETLTNKIESPTNHDLKSHNIPHKDNYTTPQNKPVTYVGSKGQYTVNYEAGTYYGCVNGTGCLYLGRDNKNRRFLSGKWNLYLFN